MRHDDPGERELRRRLSELADAAGRSAAMPSPAMARRRRSRGRPIRRATAAVAVLAGALAGPAAVGAGLVSFPTGSEPRPAATSPSPAAPPAGRILPPAPPPPGASQQPGQPPWTPAQPSIEPGPSGPPPATAPPSSTPTPPPTSPAPLPQEIWLSDGTAQDAAGCALPARASRRLDEKYPALQALRLVLDGPGPGEAARGLRSAPELAGLTIRTYGVVGQTARVDFDPLPAGAALPPRSCRKAELLQPMNWTLLQFTNISEVRYSIQGSETAFYRDLIGIDVPER